MTGGTADAEVAALARAVSGALSDGYHSEETLVGLINSLRPILAPTAADEQIAHLSKQLRGQLNIDFDLGEAITSKDFVSWLPDRKPTIEWSRWKTYKQWMLNQGRSPKVMDTMDQLTDQILDFVGDPTKEGQWSRRGLVIGDVQSGKTATYLGLFNKAADAGYRLIIVLAGNTESLRQQTQSRVDEGFIGRDSGTLKPRPGVAATPTKRIGVGLLGSGFSTAQGMTTVVQDFRRSSQQATNITVDRHTAEPHIFVVKKNKSVLKALHDWLQQQAAGHGRIDVPLLLLDDESDYASVNTKDEHNPTAINKGIRAILDSFTRSSYLAFTATPFANIFIDHGAADDLFPRDFVYSLDAPSNYVGAERVFGSAGEAPNTEHTMDLSDAGAYFPTKHKSDHVVTDLPESLRQAVRVFLLGNAIRDIRGDLGARSMLINVSRFRYVQRQVFDLVESYTIQMRQAIELHSAAFSRGAHNADLSAMQETFEDVYASAGTTWAQVLDRLASATADVRVELHNSDRDQSLAEEEVFWDRPSRLIAVGGDVLSRGLTLEGLMVSYFYRSVGAFDTLMQMARWFGYRDGYEDLCRIWIADEVAADYRFVDEAVRELRDDLIVMKQQKRTPEDFGIAIRKHPGTLLVTARNKMKSAAVMPKSVSLSGRRIESTKLSLDTKDLTNNREAFERLLDTLGAPDEDPGRRHHRWQGVPKDAVADFLDAFRADQSDPLWKISPRPPLPGRDHSPSHLGEFARSAKSPAYQTWDVVLMSGHRTDASLVARPSLTYWKVSRKVAITASGRVLISGTSSRLAGSSDLTQLLTPEEQQQAEAAYLATKDDTRNIPESAYYNSLARPALLLYPLAAAPELPNDFDDAATRSRALSLKAALEDAVAVAVKLAIPGSPADVSNNNGDAEYVINTVAQESWLAELGTDDDVDG